MDEITARKEIVKIGERLYMHGYALANGGNISIRLSSREVLITPTGECLGDLVADELPKVNMSGKVLSGDRRPSAELRSHLNIYHERPDVNGIIHAHPPYATGLAIAGEKFERFAHPETYCVVGRIAVLPYATPEGNPELVTEPIRRHDVLVMTNHGVLTVGTTLKQAHFKMESLEMLSHAMTVAKIHGAINYLTDADLKLLDDFKKKHFG
ncbi:MAG: class II aldolase/adducin family protein [Planctomycetota bacterium]